MMQLNHEEERWPLFEVFIAAVVWGGGGGGGGQCMTTEP